MIMHAQQISLFLLAAGCKPARHLAYIWLSSSDSWLTLNLRNHSQDRENGHHPFPRSSPKHLECFCEILSQSLAKSVYWFNPLLKVIHSPLQNLLYNVLPSKTYYTSYSTGIWIILLQVMDIHVSTESTCQPTCWIAVVFTFVTELPQNYHTYALSFFYIW